MLTEIKSAFKNGSKQLTWLDQVTKTTVENKVRSLFLALREMQIASWAFARKILVVGHKEMVFRVILLGQNCSGYRGKQMDGNANLI